MKKKRIGIVGFGHIGEYLYKKLKESNETDIIVDFVWNRSRDKLQNLPANQVLDNLDDFMSREVDLIIEVAHISITHEYGEKFLQKADFMIGSPTALADEQLEKKLTSAAHQHDHGLYVPAGAFWGGEDVRKMADQGTLRGLKVTMKKHPSSFRLLGDLVEKNNQVGDKPVILYDGPVRQLCPLAPANVNTMACAAIAANNLGFDKVQGCLVSDRSLNSHVIEIDLSGPSSNGTDSFTVKTVRNNPCVMGAVTGNATYASFFESMKRAHGKGVGVHLC